MLVSCCRVLYVNLLKISTTAPTRIQNIRRASFTVNGPRIFNSLPQYIRDTTKCDKNVFKAHLDHYLQQVPDQPLTACRMCDSNSLIDWSRNAQLKTQLEEPPERTLWRQERRLSTVTSASRAETYPKYPK